MLGFPQRCSLFCTSGIVPFQVLTTWPRGPACSSWGTTYFLKTQRHAVQKELVASFPWLSRFLTLPFQWGQRDSLKAPAREDPVAVLITMVRLGLKGPFIMKYATSPICSLSFSQSLLSLFHVLGSLPSKNVSKYSPD